jgi:hypothetical protein
MKLFLNQTLKTITTLTLAAVAATIAAGPASAQLSALKNASKTAEDGPAPVGQVPAATSPIVGAWQGGVQGPQQRMLFQMMVFADGTYKARIVIETAPGPNNNPTEPTITQYNGQWKVEGRELVLTNDADQSVERTPIELRGDSLVLKGIVPNGGDMTMQRVQPNAGPNPVPVGPNGPVGTNGPATNGPRPTGLGPTAPIQPQVQDPGPNRQPERPSPAPAPVVGTWYAAGNIEGVRLDCQVQIMPNGNYQSQINIRNGSVNSQISEQGTWKTRGRKIVFETEEEVTSIPFKVEGNTLILDYSEDAGIVAILSPTPGQGQIRAVGQDYGY